MEIALRAYEDGVCDYGPTRSDIVSSDGQEKWGLVQEEKIAITSASPARFPLSNDEIREALCLLPVDWLRHARLQQIRIIPTQYFCFRDMCAWDASWAGNYFIRNVIDGVEAEEHFLGKTVTGLQEQHLIGPPTRFHYAPGQYRGEEDIPHICLWEEPKEVKRAIGVEARREYGRELVVHEALHSIFGEHIPIEFFVCGRWKGYWDLMSEFHAICQDEPVAITEYSELYAPWLRLPLNTDEEKVGWKERFRMHRALQEELGELLSACVRGWGASPQGKAVRPLDRDFGGTTFHDSGVSRKVAFVEALLQAPVRIKTPTGGV